MNRPLTKTEWLAALDELWEAAQQPRPWVGLTDEELDDIAVVARRGNLHDLRIAIEAKLKERNT
jgi:hypothetical protein